MVLLRFRFSFFTPDSDLDDSIITDFDADIIFGREVWRAEIFGGGSEAEVWYDMIW